MIIEPVRHKLLPSGDIVAVEGKAAYPLDEAAA
jgi:hypothetical protein